MCTYESDYLIKIFNNGYLEREHTDRMYLTIFHDCYKDIIQFMINIGKILVRITVLI